MNEPLQRYNLDEMGTSCTFQSATPEADAAVQKCEKPNNGGHCSGVAVQKGGDGLDGGEWRALAEGLRALRGVLSGPVRRSRPTTLYGKQYLLHPSCEQDWLDCARPGRLGLQLGRRRRSHGGKQRRWLISANAGTGRCPAWVISGHRRLFNRQKMMRPTAMTPPPDTSIWRDHVPVFDSFMPPANVCQVRSSQRQRRRASTRRADRHRPRSKL